MDKLLLIAHGAGAEVGKAREILKNEGLRGVCQ
jgi:hypothetical protein